MRFLEIFQGLRLSTISPWYHSATFLAGLCVDTSSINPIYYEYPTKTEPKNVDISVALIKQTFDYCVASHALMVVFAIVITIFNTKGRYNNKVDSTP